MAILSRFLASAGPLARSTISHGKSVAVQQQLVRSCAHRTMNIEPSRWAWNKFKDELHFYFWMPTIAVAILIHGVNIFIGPAELADTPEGYVPEYHEYYRHPITRWFCKYVYSDSQANYERTMHTLQSQYEKTMMKRVAAKVRELQQIRGDYQGSFYLPNDAAKYAELKIYERENITEGSGFIP